jgi:hypothetical protein
MLRPNDERREYRETLTGHGRDITETQYSRDNTRLYESNYEATVGSRKGEFIVGACGTRAGAINFSACSGGQHEYKTKNRDFSRF